MARTTAHPIRWVKLILLRPERARNPLMTLRFTSSSFAGTLRKLVAVGTVEARLHVAHNRRAGPAYRIAEIDRNGGRLDCRRRSRSRRVNVARRHGKHVISFGWRPVRRCDSADRRRRRGGSSNRGGGCRIVGKELPPLITYRVGVPHELLVHLLDEPGVCTEVGPCSPGLICWRCHVRQGNQARPIAPGTAPNNPSDSSMPPPPEPRTEVLKCAARIVNGLSLRHVVRTIAPSS